MKTKDAETKAIKINLVKRTVRENLRGLFLIVSVN